MISMKPKPKYPLTQYKSSKMLSLARKTDHKVLGMWALECTNRVMKYSKDSRPRKALQELKKWIKTGEFHMAVIRKASLYSHAAAKECEGSCRSACHAAGQAVATAHAPMHSVGAAIYALQAVHIATNSEANFEKEREWQYNHLVKLRKGKKFTGKLWRK